MQYLFGLCHPNRFHILSEHYLFILNCIYMSRTKCRIRAVVASHSTLVSLLPRCSRVPTEKHSSPVEAVLTGSEAALLVLIEIPKSPADMALLTKAKTIIMLEGSRLHPRDVLDASQPKCVRHQPYTADKGKPGVRTKS